MGSPSTGHDERGTGHFDRSSVGWLVARAIQQLTDTGLALAFVTLVALTLPPAQAGLASAAVLVPGGVLLLVGGAVADRHNTRRVLLVSFAIEGALAATGAAGILSGANNLWFVVVTMASLGAVNAFSLAAFSSLLVQLAEGPPLGTLLGINQTCIRVATLLGAPLGTAALVALGGDVRAFGWLLAAHTVGVVVSWLATWRLLVLRFPKEPTPGGVFTVAREGLRAIATTPPIRRFLAAVLGANLWSGPVLTLGLAMAVTGRGTDASWVGLATSALGGLAIVGTLVSVRVGGVPLRAAFALFAAQGLLCMAVGWSPVWVLVVVMGLVGFTSGAGSHALAQEMAAVVPKNQMGRVQTTFMTADSALVPATTAIFGALAGRLGLGAACVVFGGIMGVTFLRSALTYPRSRAADAS